MRIRPTYIDLMMLSLLALVPLAWFREGYGVIAGFDFAVYLNPVDTLKRSMFVWSDRMAGGYDLSHEVSSIPYYLMFSVPMLLGSSLYGAQKFVFSMIFALQGLSMYCMLRALFPGHKARRALSLSGAFAYAFSYPVMAHFGRGNMMSLLAYAVLPALLALLYKGFSSGKGSNRYAALAALLTIPACAIKGHPADFVVITGVAFFFMAFHIVASLRAGGAGKIIWFSAKTLLASILVNVWWIIPNIIYLADFGLDRKDLLNEGFYNIDILSYYSRGTSILNVFRNERLDLWFDIPADAVFNPGLYQTAPFIVIGLVIPVVSFAALLLRRPGINAYFFSVLAVLAIFMCKGNHYPFGNIFEWLYMNVPGFFFFRAPYRVFSSLVTFSTTPLLALSVAELWARLKRRKKSASPVLRLRSAGRRWVLPRGSLANLTISASTAFFLITISFYAWPVFTGAHMRERGPAREPGVFHRIPDAYYAAGRWADENSAGAKVYYPYEIYDSNMDWGYNGPDPSFELIEAPKVVSRPGGTVYIRYQRPIEALNRVIWDWEYGDLKKILGIYNIKFLLLHNDYNRWVLPFYNFNEYAKSLFRQYGVTEAKKAGALEFYENAEYSPRVFGSKAAYLLIGDERSFRDLSLTDMIERPFLMMAKDARNLDEAKVRIETADAVIFHNSLPEDGLAELLYSQYGAPIEKDSVRFKTEHEGVHEVYVKNAPAGNRLLFPEGFNPGEAEKDGIDWKRLGTLAAGKGEQSKKAVWLFNSKKTGGVKIEIAPKDLRDSLRRALLEKMGRDGFDVAYLFDKKAYSKRPVLELPGSLRYNVSTSDPVRYGRYRKNAAEEQGDWKTQSPARAHIEDDKNVVIHGPGRARVTREINGIDAGQYPEFSFDSSLSEAIDKGLKVLVSMEFRDLGGARETLVLKGEDLINNGLRVNLMEALRKNSTTASFHKLRSIALEMDFDGVAMDKPVRFGLPSLNGEFGLERLPCERSGGASKDVRSENLCGRWQSAGVAGPGRYSIDANGGKNGLVYIRKGVSKPQLGEVTFERINPALYRVKAEKGAGRLIVFNESFNSGWTLHVNGNAYKPVKANGYANGFVLNEPGPFEGVIEYSPQRAFDYSKAASAISFIGVGAAALYRGRGEKEES